MFSTEEDGTAKPEAGGERNTCNTLAMGTGGSLKRVET